MANNLTSRITALEQKTMKPMMEVFRIICRGRHRHLKSKRRLMKRMHAGCLLLAG